MDWQGDGRLPAELWIKAHLRRCFAEGMPATVVHRGEKNSGTLILKINQLEAGCRVLSQTRNLDGDLAWMAALDGRLVAEGDADAYIDRAVARDRHGRGRVRRRG